jgi:hypothetical protein
MIAPMMQGMQESLKVQSNTIFRNNGNVAPLERAQPAGIYN